jgi:hypothetical protein
MLKRKQMIVAAAALAAAPLASKAAVTLTFAYDSTVTYGTNAAVTGGTGTVSIVNNTVTIPSGDFFRFNVNVLVTGDTNAASGGAFDTSQGTTQPPLLGLTGFGYNITTSAVANDTPRSVGGNASIVNLAPANSGTNAYSVSTNGTVNATSGLITGLTGGLNPGAAKASKSTSYSR